MPKGFEFLSGLPEAKRKRWRILTMKYQAFIDDSGGKRQGRWMALSGLFGEATAFADLADKWERNLAGPYPPGRISYFKMDEAVTKTGEFNSWSDEHRDAKVWQLARLIDRDDLLQIGALLSIGAFEKFAPMWRQFKEPKVYSSMDEPYVLLAQQVFTTAITEAVARHASTPMDIFFDIQTRFKETLNRAFNDMLEMESTYPERRAVMPHHLMMRDDREFLPLQAADLLAGELRLCAEDYPDNPDFIGKLCPHLRTSPYCIVIGEEQMQEMHLYLTTRVDIEARLRGQRPN